MYPCYFGPLRLLLSIVRYNYLFSISAPIIQYRSDYCNIPCILRQWTLPSLSCMGIPIHICNMWKYIKKCSVLLTVMDFKGVFPYKQSKYSLVTTFVAFCYMCSNTFSHWRDTPLLQEKNSNSTHTNTHMPSTQHKVGWALCQSTQQFIILWLGVYQRREGASAHYRWR